MSTSGPTLTDVDPEEWHRLTHALAERFGPHLEAAAGAVREAEQQLTDARDALARAQQEAANRSYQSDRLVFMRASVQDEAEALTRKTTPKKLRVAYRYLLARAVELAEAEVQGYRADQADAQREREHSVEACAQAEREAADRLAAARAMQSRVLAAEQTARAGLAVLLDKLRSQPEEPPAGSALS